MAQATTDALAKSDSWAAQSSDRLALREGD